MRTLLSTLCFAVVLAAPAAAQQGPGLDFTPPDQAVSIGGSLSGSGWLNVADAPLSLQEAMTGLPLEAGAIANMPGSAIIEVTFQAGVTNGPGDDLAILDAQFDDGIYWIETDYDQFIAGLSVNTAGNAVCVAVDYYFELNAAGPFPAEVIAAGIDLSDLGVPVGATVHRLRYQPLSAGCDPVTLAKIGAGFHLASTDLHAGTNAQLRMRGATPQGRIGIGYSLAGGGPSSVLIPGCGALDFDLGQPVRTLAVLRADASGAAEWVGLVPPQALGLTLWLQAVDVASCTLSNQLVRVVD